MTEPEAFIDAWHRNARALADTYDPPRSMMPAASAWSPPSTASRAAKWWSRHRGAQARCGIAARSMPMARPATAPASISRSRRTSSRDAGRARPATSLRPGPIAVGQVFLPRTDLGAQERCRTIVETEILRFGYYIYGWRQVPVNVAVHRREGQRHAARDRADHDLRTPAAATSAGVRARALRHPPAHREAGVIAAQIPDFYVCSLSCRSIIYKGMFLAEQPDGLLSRPDRRALRLAASRSSISATRPTPSRPGGWRSPSACSPITARSTR